MASRVCYLRDSYSHNAVLQIVFGNKDFLPEKTNDRILFAELVIECENLLNRVIKRCNI